MKLDAKIVASLRLGDKNDVIYFDDTLPGFGLRLRRGAGDKINKSWIAQYRRVGTRRVLIGNAAVVNAEQARIAAKKILALVELGGDPQADRADRRSKDQLALRSVVTEYLAAKKDAVKPRTLVETTRYLSTGYFKPLHSMPIDAVKRKDVATRLVIINRESGSVTAARAKAALSAFFSWAMTMGYVESNPVIGAMQPQASKTRERVLSDDELAAVWNNAGDDEYGKIIRLLILTGARRAEIGGLRWSEFDTHAGTWTLPGERSKNKQAHTLPLPAMGWSIVNIVPHRSTRDQLFGLSAKEGFTEWGVCKVALDERLMGKMAEPWTVHDIRRTVATRMADLGVQPHIIEAVLNHHSGHKRGVAGVYNRSSYDREVRAALALWADHVRTLVEGGERKIVALPSAAT